MKRTWIAVMLVLVAALAAQDFKGRARQGGTIADESGAPIDGVTVKLFSLKAQQGLEVKSDKSGRWMAAWIRGGGWRVTFSKVGYAPQSITLDVMEGGKNPDVKVVMTKIEGLAMTDEIRDLLIKGNAAFEQGQFDEALTLYTEILAKQPDAYPIYRNIGNCHFAKENYDQAEANYLKVLEKNPKDAESIIAIGNCYSNRGDSAKALEWYGKIEFERIDDPVILYNMGISYYNNGRFEDALKLFVKAVEKQRDSTDAIYQMGLTYLNLQKTVEALAAFESYLKVDADSPRADQVRGFIDYLKKK
jgi:predicted negative regulator of RcsB-dependent stress response